MKKGLTVTLVAAIVVLAGCETTDSKVWTWNQRQALARSGGDIAMTALIDQGVDKAEAVEVCKAIAEYIENGAMSKIVFQKYVTDKVPTAYADWADALFLILDNVGLEEQIPPEIRTAILSFLNDGALYGAKLYSDEHAPKSESTNGGS